jgi:hypothetical protein
MSPPSSASALLLALALLSGAAEAAYNRSAALAYVARWWNGTNHDCSTPYTACSPFSYWGGESCGYPSHGGDCADFVSQSLLAGGHVPLTKEPCRGYPCGREEVGAQRLGACLAANYNWTSKCGPRAAPPTNIVPGDVLIFHVASCDDTEAHATVVTYVNLPYVGISAHSTDHHNVSVEGYWSEFGYGDWLHFEGPTV